MRVSKKLAEYVICLQGIADAEIGNTKQDYDIRDQLEQAFPSLRKCRERRELQAWLWSIRVEEEPDVIEARSLTPPIFFDEVYNADCPSDSESTYHLYQEHMKVAIELFQDVKHKADRRLWHQHKAGQIDLVAEWRRFAEIERIQRLAAETEEETPLAKITGAIPEAQELIDGHDHND